MKSCLSWLNICGDPLRLLALGLRSKSSLAAENLFLRKQLAFYQERKIKPRRTDNPTRLTLVWLGRWFDWRNALAVVTPKTFIGWHRMTFQLFWHWKCQSSLSRRIIHANLTAHPTAAWALQQLREAIPSDHAYRLIIHDRDVIFSTGLDASVAGLGLEVIKTPVRSPKANSPCERLIGTLRRECLDWIIPLTEKHLRNTLMSWLPHYNRSRPRSSLGPSIPDPPPALPVHLQRHRHRFDQSTQIVAHSVLNGLHHEYSVMARTA